MTRFTKDAKGYHISGKVFEVLEGSRAQVWHGTAYKTSGGLTKSHLMQNKNGRIVSTKKHQTAKKEMRLVKAGYGTKKGKFGFVKLSSKSRKHRGGGNMMTPPASTMTPSSMYETPYPHSNMNVSAMGSKTISKMGGRHRKGKKGGMLALTPEPISGIESTSGADLQLMATNY